VLTVAGKTAPTDPSSYSIDNLRLSPAYFQVKLTIIGINAVLYFSPQKDRDGLIIDINSFTIISHFNFRKREGTTGFPPVTSIMVLR